MKDCLGHECELYDGSISLFLRLVG
jgi:hypothetical protein